MKPRNYAIPDDPTIEALKARLREDFFAITETTETTQMRAYDTFDWRLYNQGLLLLRQENRVTLVEAAVDAPIVEVILDSARPLRFHEDIPASAMKARLKMVLEMRALLPVVAIKKTAEEIAVLNSDEKTVVRLQLATLSLDGQDGDSEAVRRCRIAPLRGYAKAARTVAAIIDDMGLPAVAASPVPDLIVKNGAAPGAYSSKVDVSLDPDMASAEAVKRIMLSLVEVMRVNLPGVREDIDTEFLHDFRVSVRRARSLLGQTGHVLDSTTTTGLQAQLKAIGGMTGSVRDLDVYLLAREDYVAKVPEFLQPGVVRLFQALQRRRRYMFQQMVNALDQPEFASAMAGLETFVGGDPLADSDAPAGKTPIRETACAVIHKRFRKVIKKGRQISESTPDARLHELRIDCKKLRYLLEFFTSLFPADDMQKLVKQLKKLQDNLGTFNDLSVQQAFLADYLGTIKPTMAQALLLAAATGGLITRLATDQRRVREAFFTVFAAFDAPDNRRRFKVLFA